MLKQNNLTITTKAYVRVGQNLNYRQILKDVKGIWFRDLVFSNDLQNNQIEGIEYAGTNLFTYFDEEQFFVNLSDKSRFKDPKDYEALVNSKENDVLLVTLGLQITEIKNDTSHQIRVDISDPIISDVRKVEDIDTLNLIVWLIRNSSSIRKALTFGDFPYDIEYCVKQVSNDELFSSVSTDAAGIYCALDFAKNDEGITNEELLLNSVLCGYTSLKKDAESLEEAGFLTRYVTYYLDNKDTCQKGVYSHKNEPSEYEYDSEDDRMRTYDD